MHTTKAFVFVLFAFLFAAHNAGGKSFKAANPFEKAEVQGLYSPQDDVEILTSLNFRERVFNQPHASVVEFYNSWCGFCQRFAPSWKALATDTLPWKSMVSVGAIDCSDDMNSQLCREFEIMGYPALRYFHENYRTGIGRVMRKGNDLDELKYELMKEMVSEQRIGRGLVYPNLLPYRHSTINNLFEGSDPRVVYAFLVVDDAATMYGAHLALDFANVPEIVIRYADFNSSDLIHNLGIKKLPYMVATERSGKMGVYLHLKTVDELRNAIIEYVKPTLKLQYNKGDVFRGKWIEVEVPDIATLMREKEKQAIRQKIKEMGDAVYQVDLETALKRSLLNEVAARKDISGERLSALRGFVNVIRKYFPLGRNGQVFLMDLFNLVNSRSVVHGQDIANLVHLNEGENKFVFSSEHSWMACEGSTTAKRGYPCGLWKLFHYLTVQAANTAADPKEVLYAMHGYIKNFFGCEDCSRHFQQMAKERDIDGVSSLNGAILWLWSAHNVVNNRLSGDATEDPEYPKVQFPTRENCARCRGADGKWKYPEVLRYLKTMYSRHNIKYLGTDMRLFQQHTPVDSNVSSSVFEQIDSSMCFILYVFSFILIIILIRMFLKRGYRKKMYAHDLLGKV